MAGAYCKFCDRRCFVSRQVIVAGVLVWAGHMATCRKGKDWDRSKLGVDADTAHNPVWDGCTCPNVCGLKAGTRPCNNKLEPDGEPCFGKLAFAQGDEQAQCPDCGGWMGRLAPGYDQYFTVAAPNASEVPSERDR